MLRLIILALISFLLSACALLAPAPGTSPGRTSDDSPPIITGPDANGGSDNSTTAPAVPRPNDNFASTFQNRELERLLRPNDPSLSYPIYAEFSEIEPLLRQQDGVTYLINFWATWCRPCIKEMPLLEQLRAEDPNVRVIAVSLDKPRDVRTKMKDYLAESGLQLPVVAFTEQDYQTWIGRVSPDWGRATIPATLVYQDGRRVFNKGAVSSIDELRGLVRRVR